MVTRHLFTKKMKKIFTRAMFPVIGLASTVWFLIRVIPKPSRASYPCMRVAFPLASTFITYLLSLSVAILSLHKVRNYVAQNKYRLAVLFLFIGMLSSLWFISHTDNTIASSVLTAEHTPNDPMGTGIGIHPGRVIWIYDPDATNEACSGYILKDGVINDLDNLWFQEKNNNQEVIDSMVSVALQLLTGEESNSQA